tara:strand:- start:3164 stop:3454 length:291 start_codon:yes stop_codon:yes gene_type:complete
MLMIEIKPNTFSSRRTRNRIAEHGPEFDWSERVSAVGSNGFSWLLHCSQHGKFCSSCSDNHDQWCGWLPRKEFDIVGVKCAMRPPTHQTSGIVRLM